MKALEKELKNLDQLLESLDNARSVLVAKVGKEPTLVFKENTGENDFTCECFIGEVSAFDYLTKEDDEVIHDLRSHPDRRPRDDRSGLTQLVDFIVNVGYTIVSAIFRLSGYVAQAAVTLFKGVMDPHNDGVSIFGTKLSPATVGFLTAAIGGGVFALGAATGCLSIMTAPLVLGGAAVTAGVISASNDKSGDNFRNPHQSVAMKLKNAEESDKAEIPSKYKSSMANYQQALNKYNNLHQAAKNAIVADSHSKEPYTVNRQVLIGNTTSGQNELNKVAASLKTLGNAVKKAKTASNSTQGHLLLSEIKAVGKLSKMVSEQSVSLAKHIASNTKHATPMKGTAQ